MYNLKFKVSGSVSLRLCSYPALFLKTQEPCYISADIHRHATLVVIILSSETNSLTLTSCFFILLLLFFCLSLTTRFHQAQSLRQIRCTPRRCDGII